VNWLRNSHFHARHYGDTFTTASAGKMVAPQWWHGPGNGGATSGGFQETVQGEWAGNPERFLRIHWTGAPQSGDAEYPGVFRFTFLEQWINTARIMAGKIVTFSGQIRGGGGVPIIPIIWRSFTGMPITVWSGAQFSPYDTVTRFDFTMTMPGIPSGQSVALNSYIGIGLDIPGQYGPTFDIGPMQFHEGAARDFEECPAYQECWWALQQ
jgi:hypothetical protein